MVEWTNSSIKHQEAEKINTEMQLVHSQTKWQGSCQDLNWRQQVLAFKRKRLTILAQGFFRQVAKRSNKTVNLNGKNMQHFRGEGNEHKILVRKHGLLGDLNIRESTILKWFLKERPRDVLDQMNITNDRVQLLFFLKKTIT